MGETTLKRSIGVPLLTLYGLGTILGAGIYVLIGEVAAVAGLATPSAFVLAAVVAGITALSYAELASRLPKSAGEAAYIDAGFGRRSLAQFVGWAVIFTGTVSAATLARGFVGYFTVFATVPSALVIVTTMGILGVLAAWGISESLIAAAVVTVLEIGGLIFVCAVGLPNLTAVSSDWTALLPDMNTTAMAGVASGAFLAFYAFIGFEDMVNVAEEVKEPRQSLPRAIILALIVSTSLYLIVAVVAVTSMPIDQLAGEPAPLARLIESRGYSPFSIAAISLLAVLNGALIQIVMASRVLYGLAMQGMAWKPFGWVNQRTRTPVFGTACVTLAIIALAISFSLGNLARVTSFVALSIFILVNAALWKLKRGQSDPPAFSVPIAVPVAGFFCCAVMLAYQLIVAASALAGNT